MKYCDNCGKAITDNSGKCKQCGQAVPKLFDSEIYDTYKTNFNNYDKSEQNQAYDSMKKEFGAPFWFKLLSLLIPFAGIVLFFCWRKERPLLAKECLRFALFGIILSVVIELIFPLLLSAIFGFSIFSLLI